MPALDAGARVVLVPCVASAVHARLLGERVAACRARDDDRAAATARQIQDR
jgi:2-keto-3-deoxy-L-rhamnonate aldolase RhmA